MKTLKRTLAWLLVLCMVCGFLPMGASALTNMGTKPEDGTTTGAPFLKDTTAGSTSFRIPAMVTLSDGTLVAAADARWNTTYDGGGLDTIVSRSTDGGDTWNYTFANYLGDNGNEYNGSSSTCFIDPALAVTADDTIYMLVDLYPYGIALNGSGNTAPSTAVGFDASGRLLLSDNNHSSYGYYLENGKIWSSNGAEQSGYTVDEHFNITGNGYDTNLFFSDSPFKVVRTGFLYLTTSTDGGANWSAPQLLNLKTSSEQVCLVGPGRGLVTGDGTIVFPVYSFHGDNDPSGNTQRLSFIYSTDGTTWSRTNELNYNWASESAVVELWDGTLRFFFRNGTKTLMYVDYDWDNGWSTPQSTNVYTNSNCQISAISLQNTIDNQQVILVSCPASSNSTGDNQSGASYRTNGKIYLFTVGEDNAMTNKTTVSVPSVNSSNNFMYSCLTAQTDANGNENGTISILYEDNEAGWGAGDGKYYQMSYKEYDVESDFGVTFDVVEDIGFLIDEETGVEVALTGSDTQDWTMTVIPDQTVAGLTNTYEAYDVTITKADGTNYTGAAQVTLPLGELSGISGLYPFIVEEDGSVSRITDFTIAEETITFTAPHFSVMGVAVEEAGEETPTGEDTITSSGTASIYELDTDGLDNGAQYLIVYRDSSSSTSGYALNTSKGSLNVTINGTKATPSSDASNALWTYSVETESWYGYTSYSYYLTNGSDYLYPTRSWNSGNRTYTLNITSSETSVKISNNNGTYTIANSNQNSYVAYNSGWGAQSSAQSLYFYKLTEGNEVWTVTPTLQESRIGIYTVDNEGYTDESWATYQSALAAAQNKLTEVKAGQYSSESDAQSALDELVAAVDALKDAKDALKKKITITINYQAEGITVKSESMTVAEDDASVELPTMIVVDGTVYLIDDTTLPLTAGTAAYNVTVTKLEGYAVTIAQGSELTVSPADPYGDGSVTGAELADGQYIKWSSEDSAFVGVAGVYDISSNAYTDEAVLHGTQQTTEAVTVTGTICNADGTAVSAVTWLVTVTAPDGSVSSVNRYYDVDQIEHCTLYYSINGGSLVQINGSGLAIDYIDPTASDKPYTVIDGTWYGNMSLMFFAAPDEGYALTHLYVEDSANQYYVLSNGTTTNGVYDVTTSSAWPFASSFTTYTYDGVSYTMDQIASRYLINGASDKVYGSAKAQTSIWKTLDTNNDGTTELHGFRWALLEGYMNADRLRAMYEEAYIKGCTGVTTVTKASTNNSGVGTSSDPISICAVAQKLPTIEKAISSITKTDGTTISGENVANAAIEIGDTLNYTITVTVHKTDAVTRYWNGSSLATGSTTTISYNAINVTDSLYDLKWSTTNTTSTESSNTSDKTLSADYSIVLAASNWLQYVTDGKISNTAELTYNYVAKFGAGQYGGKSDATVDAYVVLPEYVIDFGASITIDLTNDPLVDGYDKFHSVSARYGDVTYDADSLKLTYTPNQILPGMDFIRLELEDTTGETTDAVVGYGVRIYPATTVYYEEGFLFPDEPDSWDLTNVTKNPGFQTTEKLSPPIRDDNGIITGYASGKVHAYGYDPIYDGDVSNGEAAKSSASSSVAGATTTFSFTGTGFDLYADCTESSGYISVQIRDSENNIVKLFMVNTVVKGGDSSATTSQTGDMDSLPIVSIKDLDHGTYTVILTKQIDDNKSVSIDGIRIVNTLSDSSVYGIDLEDNPEFYQLRDVVLHAIGIAADTSEDYEDLLGRTTQVYNDLFYTDSETEEPTAAAIITDPNVIYGGNADIQDLLDNGPKNEIYLWKGQTLTFKVTTARLMQIGLKAPSGATAYTMKVNNTVVGSDSTTLATTVDLFYELKNQHGTETEYTVSITNTGDKVLSVTDLKICDDPNAAFVSLTEDDIQHILIDAGYTDGGSTDPEEPVEPEVPEIPEEPVITYADAVAQVIVMDYAGNEITSGTLTVNGIVGESCTFTADQLLNAAELPTGYSYISETTSDVNVAFGESETVVILAGKVATLKIVYINLFGNVVDTVTVTDVQTTDGYCRFTASVIRGAAPDGSKPLWFTNVSIPYGHNATILVPVI